MRVSVCPGVCVCLCLCPRLPLFSRQRVCSPLPGTLNHLPSLALPMRVAATATPAQATLGERGVRLLLCISLVYGVRSLPENMMMILKRAPAGTAAVQLCGQAFHGQRVGGGGGFLAAAAWPAHAACMLGWGWGWGWGTFHCQNGRPALPTLRSMLTPRSQPVLRSLPCPAATCGPPAGVLAGGWAPTPAATRSAPATFLLRRSRESARGETTTGR